MVPQTMGLWRLGRLSRPTIWEGYWEIPEFPGYMINSEGVVRVMGKGYKMKSYRVVGDGRHVKLRGVDGQLYSRELRTLVKQAVPPF